jgi:PAS domain S-box-containing protein
MDIENKKDEYKKAEEALRKSQKLLHEQLAELESVYENTPVGISYVNADLRYLRINRRLAEMNGKPASEHIGRKVSEVIPELSDVVVPIYDQVLKSRCPRLNLELSGTTVADPGNTRYWSASFFPLESESGPIQGVIAVVEDITQRKKSEKERERLLKSLDSKNRELESIVSAASHDMRTPLINAKGFAGELKKYCKELQYLLANEKMSFDVKNRSKILLEDYIPEALRFIDVSTSKAQALSDGLLKVSQFGQMEITPEPLDMDQLIKSIVETVKYQLNNSGTHLIVDPLPDCIGDGEQISQAFTNLVDNAIKYREPSRKGQIHITGTVESGQSIYCVEDNGIGISESSLDKVFEIFHRLNPEGTMGGEGIGLSIVSRIVERAGGRIWLESNPGTGSKFFVSLPTV